MARITIEDCMEQVPNRFQLVQMASIRAKQLKKGARPLLSGEQNKEVVTALREIAAGVVKPGAAFADASGIVPDGSTPFAETSVTGGIAPSMQSETPVSPGAPQESE